MKELEEKEIEELEELGRLTTDELKEKKKELELYECEMYRKRRILKVATRAAGMIDIYERGGFRGMYKYLYEMMYHTDAENEREDREEGLPF